MSDAQEYLLDKKYFISNPCSFDTDHDGISDRWEYDSGSDPLVADANGDVDGDGTTNWQAYVLAQAAADAEAGISITNGDHELDLRGNQAFMQLGNTPQATESMTLMSWVKFSQVKG
ncbi:TPA: hypothetical protein NK433_004812, partial [Vibrio parahaemolyticus]|nr:hypothetical protein [Vibrio parahaemolyticus]